MKGNRNMYNVKVVESLKAFQGAIGFFPGTKVCFDTLEDAYNWAKVPIDQGAIVVIEKDENE